MNNECCLKKMNVKHGKEGITVHNYEPRGVHQPEKCPHGNMYYMQDADMMKDGGNAPRRRFS